VSDPDDIRKTYINTTKAQRNYYIHLMQEEKKRTNDGSLNLSEWIIRQLPPVPDDWKKQG
jgi:hypothetical protein